jgi:hypothetical protein
MAFLESLLEGLFRQSELVQFGVFAVNGLIFFAAGMALIRIFNRRPNPSAWTPVGPYFSAVSVIFALFLAFHASDIWAGKNKAERAYIEAGSAVRQLDDLSGPEQLDLPGLRSALRHYVRYVFRDEWRKTRNRSPSERAQRAFHDLQLEVMQASRSMPAPIATQLNKLFNDIERARADQLWLGANPTDATSWLAVWLLGLLAHLAVAAVHFDKPKAGAVALTLVALATVVAFWSLGVVDDPYHFSDDLNPQKWLPDG